MSLDKFRQIFSQTLKGFSKILPLIFGTILLVSLVITLIPDSFYSKFFTGNIFYDSFIGSLIGSISAGTPLVSYIFGGELLEKGVGLLAVTAFLVSWVTVGVIQLPAEIVLLGRRFAIVRNLVSFFFAILVALTTVIILGGFS